VKRSLVSKELGKKGGYKDGRELERGVGPGGGGEEGPKAGGERVGALFRWGEGGSRGGGEREGETGGGGGKEEATTLAQW